MDGVSRGNFFAPMIGGAALAATARVAVERFQLELPTDYLDLLRLHYFVKPDWVEEMTPYMNALSEEKAAGQIKAVGGRVTTSPP